MAAVLLTTHIFNVGNEVVSLAANYVHPLISASSADCTIGLRADQTASTVAGAGTGNLGSVATASKPVIYTGASRTFDWSSATTNNNLVTPIAPNRTGEYSLAITSYLLELATNTNTWPAMKITFRECRLPTMSLNPATPSVSQVYTILDPAEEISNLPTFHADQPACLITAHSIDPSVSLGGNLSNVAVSLEPNSTAPKKVNFKVNVVTPPCTNCEVDKTFTLVVTASVGGSSITYTIVRLVQHLCQQKTMTMASPIMTNHLYHVGADVIVKPDTY